MFAITWPGARPLLVSTQSPSPSLLPPNPTLPFFDATPPPPPPPCGTPPNRLEELQTDAVEGPACRWLLEGECLSTPPPPTPPPPPPHPPLPFLPFFCETLFPPFLSWGRPGCRGGARKRLQFTTNKTTQEKSPGSCLARVEHVLSASRNSSTATHSTCHFLSVLQVFK